MNKPSLFTWRPTTTIVLITGFIAVLIAIVIAFSIENFKPTTSVFIGSGVYQVSLADTDAKRTKGLSGVDKLQMNGGMLFDFETEANWGIWMKDMNIPVDIVWMDKTKKVVHIQENAKPEWGTKYTMQPKSPARFVLELPAGSVKNAGIRMNEVATFDIKERE